MDDTRLMIDAFISIAKLCAENDNLKDKVKELELKLTPGAGYLVRQNANLAYDLRQLKDKCRIFEVLERRDGYVQLYNVTEDNWEQFIRAFDGECEDAESPERSDG